MFSLPEYQGSAVSAEELMPGADPARSGCEAGPILQTGSLPEETGTRSRLALSVSLCAEGSAVAAISGHDAICGLFLLVGVSAITWIYRAESHLSDRTNRRSRSCRFLTVGAAIMVPAIGLLLLIYRPYHGISAQMGTPKQSIGYQNAQRAGGSDDSYVAVILWPKHPRDVKVVSPSPHRQSATVARPKKPFVIPFEGVYWYLRAPAKAPGPDAHFAHGSPTRINIHSTDWWHPLIMEAHQRLFTPIEVHCCRELDLSILNADQRPGAISIAVELIDSSSPHVKLLDLGSRPVLSSMAPEFSLNRSPTNEVLKYAIPANPAIRHFNEIEVIFLLSRERSLGGAQIAIRSFTLMPLR